MDWDRYKGIQTSLNGSAWPWDFQRAFFWGTVLLVLFLCYISNCLLVALNMIPLLPLSVDIWNTKTLSSLAVIDSYQYLSIFMACRPPKESFHVLPKKCEICTTFWNMNFCLWTLHQKCSHFFRRFQRLEGSFHQLLLFQRLSYLSTFQHWRSWQHWECYNRSRSWRLYIPL